MDDLQRIRVDVAGLRAALSAAACREFRGAGADRVSAYQRHPAAWHAESLGVIDEAHRKSEADGPGLQRLRAAVVSARVEASAVRLQEALAEAETAAVVEGPEGQLPLRAALRAVALEPQRGRRHLLAAACARTVAEEEGRRADWVALRQEALGREGVTPAQLAGFDSAPLLTEARAVLHSTADAYRELLPWALSRWVQEGLQRLPRGDLEAHDLAWLKAAAFLGGAFPGGALRLAAQGLVESMDFDARRRTVRLDLERRPLARIGACIDGASIFLSPLGTPADWREIFGALPIALRHASAGAPGEGAEVQAFAALFRGIVRQPLFYRKVLPSPRGAAEDAVRAFALLDLLELRTLCGLALYEQELFVRPPSRSLARTFGELLADATGARHDERYYLHPADLTLPASTRLRGLALAGAMEPVLLERCNEDWWRNPRTGPYLQSLWATAGRAGVPASLEPWARQLLTRM